MGDKSVSLMTDGQVGNSIEQTRILDSRRARRHRLRLGSPMAPAITGDDHGPATVVTAIDTGDVRDADVWEVS